MLDSVVIPLHAAQVDFDVTAPDEVEAYVDMGAGAQVGKQAPMQLDPVHPNDFQVQAPVQNSEVKTAVTGDINSVFLALGAVALIVGGIGFANITLLSVMERVGEIGLRRALGASKKAIAIQFIAESAMIGLSGGLTGAALSVGCVVGICAAKSWTPVLALPLVAGSALLGGVIGLLAGIYPALRAATIQPITALRSGVERLLGCSMCRWCACGWPAGTSVFWRLCGWRRWSAARREFWDNRSLWEVGDDLEVAAVSDISS